MSGYNIEYFLHDFAKRTISNLTFVEEHAEQHELFEITQLINSLLGLIVIPVENYKKAYMIRDNKIKMNSPNEYLKIKNIITGCIAEKRYYSDYTCDKDKNGRIYVSNFINHIRNAIAHGGNNGIHFYPISEDGNISKIFFYDNNESLLKKERQTDNIKNISEFCISLRISELKELVGAISELYCKFEKKDNRTPEKQKKYASDIRKLEGLMRDGRSDTAKVVFDFEENENS
ncbi:HEPN family nuclease [[Clostridium] aminophilum]|uniref:HEPN family nuclease n=1 Tax=[Clostridium] aminophilum TaxID=1526 RepID=UPI00332F279A